MLKKRIYSCVCAFAMLITLIVPAQAFSTKTASESASALHAIGLFQGTGTNADGTPVFSLGNTATRAEAITMLVRLLGKENTATQGVWQTSFTDVPSWAASYIGYAYENGLTRGESSTRFGSTSAVTANDFMTLLLRALGYDDTAGDFSWSNAANFAATLGLGSYVGTANMTRGEIAKASYVTLYLAPKAASQTVLKQMLTQGIVSSENITAAGLTDALSTGNQPAGTTLIDSTALTAAQIYAKCSPAVFYIQIYDVNKQIIGSASGFFISADGKAVTNYHVIADAAYATATLSNGTTYDISGVYDYNQGQDVALIKINGSQFPYLTPSSTQAVGGQVIYAIGSPLGLDNTISQGIISNANRILDGTSYIQISAAISSGSSGGALLDEYGNVLGITSAGYDDGQNLNFAVPYSSAQALKLTNFRSLLTVFNELHPYYNQFYSSTSALTVGVGKTATLTLTSGYPSSYIIGYKIGSTKIARIAVDTPINTATNTSLSVNLTGLSAGTTNVTFALFDSNYVEVKTITVAVSVK